MRFAGSIEDEKGAEYEIIGIPFDGNSEKSGARYGPRAIRKASTELETFLWDRKIEVSELCYYDHGDLEFNGYMQLFDLLKGFKSKCIFLGGDHSISIPAVKSIDGIGAVISIDAHTDLRDTYMGNRFSNACAMRRIGEIVGFDNLVEIGVRSSSSDEYEFMRDNDKIEVYDLHAFRERGIEWIVNKIEHSRIYLSIDMDVLDASLAMGVSSVEPDGLSTNDLIRLVRRIVEEKEVIACDIVEVTPIGVMRYIAARMVFELLTSFSL